MQKQATRGRADREPKHGLDFEGFMHSRLNESFVSCAAAAKGGVVVVVEVVAEVVGGGGGWRWWVEVVER